MQVGIANENYVEILSGLSEGEEMLIPVQDNDALAQQRTINPYSTKQNGNGNNKIQNNKKN